MGAVDGPSGNISTWKSGGSGHQAAVGHRPQQSPEDPVQSGPVAGVGVGCLGQRGLVRV